MRALLVLLAVATPAWADDGEPAATFHKGQFGASVRFGLGARGIATYENTVYCGKTDPMAENGYASVCTGRSPLALDLELAYGVAQSIELTLEMRIGLERDPGDSPSVDGSRPFHIAPGARFFFSEAKHTKLFVQPEIVLGSDIGVRGIEGFWIDLHKTYGLYFFVAETLGFSRWMSASFEAGVGFQGRYP